VVVAPATDEIDLLLDNGATVASLFSVPIRYDDERLAALSNAAPRDDGHFDCE
jgi:hypothetical protein